MKISIIGLGYVGLPLALALNQHFEIICFDKSLKRIRELKKGNDKNFEFSKKEILKIRKDKFTSQSQDLRNSNIFIVTVPTPIYKNKVPNLSFLKDSCKVLSKVIKQKAIVVFESTVFPGCTEKICGPIIEEHSGLKMNKDFFLAYSPERINVGDKKNTLQNITKIVGASNKKTLKEVSKIYSKIIKAGVFECENIMVAEAAKAIENAQRDINIAFINEITLIFQKLGINIYDVLEAAKTKWNFLSFKPGLVGGHCIGVDPYYLTHISKKVGINPRVIGAGRAINDEMSNSVSKFIKKKIKSKFSLKTKYKILVLGLSFKEDTNDIRNSKAIDLCQHLNGKEFLVDAIDPLLNVEINNKNFKILKRINKKIRYNAVVLAVPHNKILKNFKTYIRYVSKDTLIFDLKNALKNEKSYQIIKL